MNFTCFPEKLLESFLILIMILCSVALHSLVFGKVREVVGEIKYAFGLVLFWEVSDQLVGLRFGTLHWKIIIYQSHGYPFVLYLD